MGAYLSSPNCDQETIEDSNGNLSFVASSMQGWRISQEDAQNAILNYDDQTSFFAVYDGHGGAEIALYASKYFPDFLRNLREYEQGNLKEALIEGFIRFDQELLRPDVKEILKDLSNEENDEEDSDDHQTSDQTNSHSNPKENSIIHHQEHCEDLEEAKLLQEEAQLPIQDLLQRYEHSSDHSNSMNQSNGIDQQEKIIEEIPIKRDSNEDQIDHPPSSSVEEHSAKAQETTESISTTIRTTTTEINSTSIEIRSNSLTKHLIADESVDDEDEDEDDEDYQESDDDDDQEEEEEDDDDDEEKRDSSTESTNQGTIRKIMEKSILAILNQQKKSDEDEEDEDDEDLEMADVENDPGSSSGCTAVVALLRNKDLYVANAGDSRCVLSRDGKAIEMSFDHKPEDPEEKQRIEKAGFKVTSDGRVSGGLNLSRALGDHAYKNHLGLTLREQAITALPDVRHITLDDRDEFFVIACDGIWNSMSSEEVIDFIRIRLGKKTLRLICEELFLHCLAPNTSGDGTGCDNMTAIIVQLHPQSTSVKDCHSSGKLALTSSISVNQKRCLSPSNDHQISSDHLEQQNVKKMKIFTENDRRSTEDQPIPIPIESIENP